MIRPATSGLVSRPGRWSVFAEYYNQTGDATAKAVLAKWIAWAEANTTLNSDGTYAIPSTLNWTGQPNTWNPSNPQEHQSACDYCRYNHRRWCHSGSDQNL